MRPLVLAWIALASIGFAQNADQAIGGTVRDAVTGLPIPDVQLRLNDARGPVPYESEGKTDSFGKFRFEKAPPGDYRLRLNKSGYVGSSYAANKIQRIKAGPGISSEDLDLTLSPTATVRGRVLDALGRPVSDVRLYAQGPVGSVRADWEKDGSYVLEGVRPGTYRLMVGPSYAYRKNAAESDPDTGTLRGYPNIQYYPGVDEPALATTITLTAGERLEGFDVRLRTTVLVELSGQVVDGVSGEPLARAEVELSTTRAGRADETYSRRRVDRNGGFRFDVLTPGRYDVLVYRDDAKDTTPYVRTVDIGKGGLADLQIAAPPFGSITGKLVVPEQAKNRGPFAILLSSQHVAALETKVRSDGSFVFEKVPPGRWTVWAGFPGFAVDFPDLYVDAIRQNGLAGPLVIAEGGSANIEIELSDRLGQFSGTVSDDDQRPVADAVVFIHGEGRRRSLTAAGDGGFTAKLPPGVYTVGAWPPGVDLPEDLAGGCGDRTSERKVIAGESSFARLEPCKP